VISTYHRYSGFHATRTENMYLRLSSIKDSLYTSLPQWYFGHKYFDSLSNYSMTFYVLCKMALNRPLMFFKKMQKQPKFLNAYMLSNINFFWNVIHHGANLNTFSEITDPHQCDDTRQLGYLQ
jgi:hypothetical protein